MPLSGKELPLQKKATVWIEVCILPLPSALPTEITCEVQSLGWNLNISLIKKNDKKNLHDFIWLMGKHFQSLNKKEGILIPAFSVPSPPLFYWVCSMAPLLCQGKVQERHMGTIPWNSKDRERKLFLVLLSGLSNWNLPSGALVRPAISQQFSKWFQKHLLVFLKMSKLKLRL